MTPAKARKSRYGHHAASSGALVVRLSLPSAVLSPNARVHWAQRARAVKAYRQQAWVAGAQALAGQDGPEWTNATEQATFYWPDARRRDRDNASAMLKAAFDGLVDAGILSDDRGLTHQPVEFAVDKNDPHVEIRIWGGL